MKTLSMNEVTEVAGGLSVWGWATAVNVLYDFASGFGEGVQAARSKE